MADPTARKPRPEAVLEVLGLTVSYGPRRVVNDVSFALRRGEILGLVGESGSGKSTTAQAILKLTPPAATIESGRVMLDGIDLLTLRGAELRRRRWSTISMVPQGAMSALNPVARVGAQIADVIATHERRRPGTERVSRLLASVGLEAGTSRLYPHQLSGGMKQRVCIAMAIALEPPVVIADEPTSALDVVVQRAVAETLKEVQARLGMSVILIGHDMGLQAQLADRVAVMCRGSLVEVGPVREIFAAPAHPYTRLLLNAVPSLRAREWRPAAAQALREQAMSAVAQATALTEVAPDHLAAVA